MAILELDFHGKSTREAKTQVEKLINKARMGGQSLDCKFITGHGEIFLELQDLLKEYELEPKQFAMNSGILEVVLE
jgi:DNA-nicking Smr family endonuclease